MGEGNPRPFRDVDTGAVVALSLRAWEPVFASLRRALGDRLYLRYYPDWRAQQAAAVEGALQRNETWVCEAGAEVAGFVNVIFDADEAAGEIYMIAVDPGFQRQGLASRLIAFAVAEMRRRGLTLATVGTGADPGHGPARRTYEKAGFTALPQVLYSMVLDPESPSP